MKKIIQVAILLGIILSYSSCDKNEYEQPKPKTMTVTKKLYSNTPGAKIRLTGGVPGAHLNIKGDWSDEYVTDSGIASLKAECDDPEVLITIEIYLNRKLEVKMQGNSWVSAIATWK